MYSVHNTLDTIAVIVWDSGFNNNFYKFSNLDNQDYQIGEGELPSKSHVHHCPSIHCLQICSI